MFVCVAMDNEVFGTLKFTPLDVMVLKFLTCLRSIQCMYVCIFIDYARSINVDKVML